MQGSQVCGTGCLNIRVLLGHYGAAHEGHKAACTREASSRWDEDLCVFIYIGIPPTGCSSGHCQGDGEESQLK